MVMSYIVVPLADVLQVVSFNYFLAFFSYRPVGVLVCALALAFLVFSCKAYFIRIGRDGLALCLGFSVSAKGSLVFC